MEVDKINIFLKKHKIKKDTELHILNPGPACVLKVKLINNYV